MSTSLSNLVNNLSEGVHNDKCTDFKSYLDYMSIKNKNLIFRCFECKNNYKKDFNKKLIKRFANTYKFCNGDINKFILLLRKGVHTYEYMDSWERFDETSFPDKEAFHSNLKMEDITNVDHRLAKRVFKAFKLEDLGQYHDLYVQNDTQLLADVFQNFRKTFLKVNELDPAQFLSASGLAWQAYLKNTTHRYAKANNEYMKNYDENNDSSFLEYLDANNLYGWAMSEPQPVNGLEWLEDLSKIDEDFIKNYDKDREKGYILEVDVEYPKTLHDLHSDLPFLTERMKIKKCSKLLCNLYDKKTMFFI